MRILAFDPGKITGVAGWNDGLFSSEMFDAMAAMAYAETAITGWPDLDLVVCESFIITQQTLKKSRGENWSLEQIGVLRFLCYREDIEFKLQSPADAKSFVKNDRLKAIGWYKSGAGHDNDASRHLLLALANRDQTTFKDVIQAELNR